MKEYLKMVNGIVIPMTEEECLQREQEEAEWASSHDSRKLEEITKKRDALLQESDYMVLPDSPVDYESAIAYRDSLRKVSEQPDLDNIIWPEKPTKTVPK